MCVWSTRGCPPQVGCAVVVKAGHSVPSLADVRAAAAAAGLAKFKRPAQLFVWPGAQLPRGDTGKPLKRAVRDWAVAMLRAPSTATATGTTARVEKPWAPELTSSSLRAKL